MLFFLIQQIRWSVVVVVVVVVAAAAVVADAPRLLVHQQKRTRRGRRTWTWTRRSCSWRLQRPIRLCQTRSGTPETKSQSSTCSWSSRGPQSARTPSGDKPRFPEESTEDSHNLHKAQVAETSTLHLNVFQPLRHVLREFSPSCDSKPSLKTRYLRLLRGQHLPKGGNFLLGLHELILPQLALLFLPKEQTDKVITLSKF